ncbi:vWA domain-containing protein [Capnocytophaga leadbetteri]|uniref:vWA domain-containing protein n=1 Tax=Capnocytophaga leadbetteri TaxID=327575 RepID=UPI0026F2404C|nr:vWA domain-containing protein [Capnocytophaga leadbetteri]
MKKLYFLSFIAALLLSACARPDDGMHDDYSMHSKESKDGQGGIQPQGGLVTAGEWNDLDNWAFYQKTLMKEPFKGFPDDWQMYTNHRIAVAITAKNKPAANATVTLFRNDTPIWTTKTDNLGRAELWVGAFQKEKELNTALLRLKVNEQWVSTAAISETQVNRIALDEALPSPTNQVQIAFMVDATGSMGDELEFLKMDLKKVIAEVQKTNTQLRISTATLFYRDEGDEYVVKHSPFTEDINQTTEFISQQRADGGGDFPEAVDKALVQLNQLQWQPEARTRIAFLVLDAPPHNKPAVISSIQYSVKTAAASGIKLIPVVASGIDKTTEFLMRFIAMYTNGTYVFITDHSGIGNKHLEPSVGEYQVEKLSDLMVRLIKKYSE